MGELFDLEDGSEGHQVPGEWRKETGSEGWVDTVDRMEVGTQGLPRTRHR